MVFTFRPDFTSKLNYGLAFGIPKFLYIPPYDKINHALINLTYNCDVKSGLNIQDRTLIVFVMSNNNTIVPVSKNLS